MSESDAPNPYASDNLVLKDGSTFGVLRTMIQPARDLVLTFENMSLDEEPEPLFKRYQHRVGTAITNMTYDAL